MLLSPGCGALMRHPCVESNFQYTGFPARGAILADCSYCDAPFDGGNESIVSALLMVVYQALLTSA